MDAGTPYPTPTCHPLGKHHETFSHSCLTLTKVQPMPPSDFVSSPHSLPQLKKPAFTLVINTSLNIPQTLPLTHQPPFLRPSTSVHLRDTAIPKTAAPEYQREIKN